MNEEKLCVVLELKNLCKATKMMRPDIARFLGVSERTLVRWLNGDTVIDLVHYKRLLNLVNKSTSDMSKT